MAKKASKDKNTKVKAKAKPAAAKVAKKAAPAKKVAEKPAKVAKVKELKVKTPKKELEKKVKPTVVVEKAEKVKKVEVAAKPKVAEKKKAEVVEATEVAPVKEVKAKASKSSLLKADESNGQKKVGEPKKTKQTKLEIDQNAKWSDLFEKYKGIKPVVYNMREVFESNQPLQHKILGWGWIMSNENDRLEVLFKDGKKILISNYKG